MTKTAFLFAGQGAQKLGMARDFTITLLLFAKPLTKLVKYWDMICVVSLTVIRKNSTKPATLSQLF